MTTTTSIPKGSTVLVTGVHGYLGMHVADQLLLDGYKVRGTVRDSGKIERTKEYFDQKYGEGNFDVSVVKDLAAVKAAWAPPPYTSDRRISVYSASKTQAEQKAWELVKNASAFKFNSINPSLILGKVLHPKQNKSTAGLVLGMMYGAPEAIAMLKMMGAQWAVNPVDVAKLHVIALTDPAVSIEERILAYAKKMNFNKVVDKLGELAGADAVKTLEKIEEGDTDLSKVDVARAEELLRGVRSSGLKGFDESLKELLDSVAA
ncbi:hypothetical protein DL95DRAFT_404140 [Leptodontidium sp. 2 PMI_412]|nr:hypothetical protein DL95DRAFT_404140 [Leptodontidium sp. 2 PMI_412]